MPGWVGGVDPPTPSQPAFLYTPAPDGFCGGKCNGTHCSAERGPGKSPFLREPCPASLSRTDQIEPQIPAPPPRDACVGQTAAWGGPQRAARQPQLHAGVAAAARGCALGWPTAQAQGIGPRPSPPFRPRGSRTPQKFFYGTAQERKNFAGFWTMCKNTCFGL